MDKVSIIVPVYNAEKFLDDCINSIINQTYKNIELILVDDGSIDRSLEICNKYKKNDKRIKVFHKKNSGVSDTRNYGIRKSTGEYIMFIDSDDYIEKNAVELMHKTISSKKVDVVRCCAKIYKQNNLDYSKEEIPLKGTYTRNEILKNINYFISQNETICCYVWSLIIKREKIINFNTQLSFMEDTEFYIRLFMNIDSIYFLHEHIYNYRYIPTGLSKNNKKCQINIERLTNSMNKIIEFFDLEKFENKQKLVDELRVKVFNSIIFQFLLASKSFSIIQTRKIIKNSFKSKIREYFKKIRFSKLKFNKKIFYCLIKFKLYLLCAIMCKILSKKN